MKYLLILTTIILMLFSKSYPQCDNVELIQEYISSSMPEERAYGCNLIAKCQLYEFINMLRDIFENENFVYPATAQLSALESLGFEDIGSLAEQFLGKIDELNADTYVDVLESKVIATRILIRYNNFSSFDFLTQIVERDRPNLTFETVYCLLQVITTGTQYTSYAKDELINLVYNADDYLLKAATLKGLAKHPDNDILTLLTAVAENDPDWSVRNIASDILLTDYYDTQQELLRSLTSSDPEKTNRLTLSRKILSDWGLPADLFTIIENLQNETDPDVITGLTYIVQNFIPPKPASLNWSGMITNLISYTTQMYQYQWIVSTEVRDYYISKLNSLKNYLQRGDLNRACTTVNNDLLARIEQDHSANAITTEAYKFLHYYCEYIKEDFTQTIGPCP